MEFRSLYVQEFDNLRSEVNLVVMDLPRKIAWIWIEATAADADRDLSEPG